MVCHRKKRQKSTWKIYVLPRLLSKSQSGKVCHSLIHISPLIFGIFRLKSDIPMNFFFKLSRTLIFLCLLNFRHMELLNDFFISYFFRGCSGYFSNTFSFSPVDLVSWFFQNEQ
jgi:hypothetical protein